MTTKTSLYRTVLQDRQDLYLKAVSDGIYTPFIYPWDTLPVLFLALGIQLSPRLPGHLDYLSRLILVTFEFVFCIARWPYVRTIGLTSGYGIGLSAFWGLIISVILLVLHDPAKDFRRIEIRPKIAKEQSNGAADKSDAASASLRRRDNKNVPQKSISSHTDDGDGANTDTGDITLVWQGYPRGNLHQLIDWTADLITSFRGINWNYRIPLRSVIVQPPDGDPPTFSTEVQSEQKPALRHLKYTAIRNFLIYYIILDFLKTTLVSEPYFLGIAPLQSPTTWPWLAYLDTFLPHNIILRFFRLGTVMIAVISALTFIFSLSPVFFIVVLPYLLNSNRIYTITKSPLLEAWMYPPQWGDFISTVCNKGIGGFWGTFWHQMFRYGISEPSKILVPKFGINPRGSLGRAIQLLVAFSLTGGIHAAASSTTFSVVRSKPWDPFFFFVLQAVAIVVQTEVSRGLNQLISFPKKVRQTSNFATFLIWAFFVGHLLADDFARCGIWLFEPVPISIFRGLGFGPADTWIPWLSPPKGGQWLGWWNGGAWYKSGLAIY